MAINTNTEEEFKKVKGFEEWQVLIPRGNILPIPRGATEDNPIVNRGIEDTSSLTLNDLASDLLSGNWITDTTGPADTWTTDTTGQSRTQELFNRFKAWTSDTWEVDLRTTKIWEVLTDEEKNQLIDKERQRIREQEWISFSERNKQFRKLSEDIASWEFFGGETQLSMERARAAEEEARIRGEAWEAIKTAEDLFAQELDLKTKQIREQGQKVMDTVQRLNSLRWGWRSSANEADIMEQQNKVTALVSAAEQDNALRLQLRKMEIEWAEWEAIAWVRAALAANEKVLNQRINSAIQTQLELDAAIWADFMQSAENLVWIMASAWVEVWDYDEKATQALWYISDSQWRPLVLDDTGNPVAPKNQFGMDSKISNFKDANDNTYVYTNWELTSIIDNQGNILKGDQLKTVKVPAQVEEDQSIAQRRATEWDLRNEFIKRPEVKRFLEIKAQFERVKQWAEADTAAWDLALIFSFMKMLDPASVVREWEFATAQNATWVPDQIRNLYNRARTWQRLNVNQRDEFKSTAEDLFVSESELFDSIKEWFRTIVEDAWARPEFVILEEFDVSKQAQIEAEDQAELDKIFSDEWWTVKTSSWKEFKIDLSGFNWADQPAETKDTISLIKEFEWFSPEAFGDFKQTSIWYGTPAKPWEKTITQQEAEKRLKERVARTEWVVDSLFPWLTKWQKAAITSFMYNLGDNIFKKPEAQKLKTAILNRDMETIKEQMVLFNKAWGKTLPWLVKRRQKELNLFLNA